jgi:hypothetical protein
MMPEGTNEEMARAGAQVLEEWEDGGLTSLSLEELAMQVFIAMAREIRWPN